jgi:hypothetical protein
MYNNMYQLLISRNSNPLGKEEIASSRKARLAMTPVTNLPEILGLNQEPEDTPKQELLAKA